MSSPCSGAGGGGPGTRYSYAELEGLWINAGGSKAYAPLMAAIAMAESGGCSSDLNPTDNGGTQTSWGLWQLSNGTHSPPVPNPLNGPANAKGAVAKLKGSGLSAWGTYDSGAYKQYLNGAVPPNLNVKGGSGGGAQTTAFTTASDPACLFGLPNVDPGSSLPIVGKFLPNTSTCLVKKSEGRAVVGGLVLVGGGVILGLGVVVLVAFGLRGARGQKAQQTVVNVGNATGVPAARRVSQQRSAGRQKAARSAPARGSHARPAQKRRGQGPDSPASGKHAAPPS